MFASRYRIFPTVHCSGQDKSIKWQERTVKLKRTPGLTLHIRSKRECSVQNVEKRLML
jgi:hypothetical protein